MANLATTKNVPVTQHEVGNVRLDGRGRVNSINNRIFAHWICGKTRVLVEVVRQGRVNTRIRRSLSKNGMTFLTKTARLENFHHVSREVLN
jgi:hypothetical protein